LHFASSAKDHKKLDLEAT